MAPETIDPALALEPKAMPADPVHVAVTRALRSLPRGSLLDVPAGEGALSLVATELGFVVTAADLDPGQFRAPALVCQRLDMNEKLPFANDSFDIVLCVEGVELIENPYALLREFRRVLRPRGHVLLATPNVLSLTSRMRQLTSGIQSYYDFGWAVTELGHIMPVSLPLLLTALERAGFDLDGLHGSRVKRNTRLLSPLVPLIRLITRRTVRPDLAVILLSKVALFSEVLVVSATAGVGEV